MRKDYILVDEPSQVEIQFVENYWTSVWERQGNTTISADWLVKKDEYRVIAPHLASLPDDAKILDGGCGLGEWVLALTRKGFNVVGADLSSRTILKLQEQFPDLPFVECDIRRMEFVDGSFDAYFSWGVFEHFESGPQDCLSEAWRILKPGGLLFISVPLDNLRQAVIGSLSKPKSIEAHKSRFYQYRFTRSELVREINLAGFEVLSTHPIHKRQGVLRSLHHEFGFSYDWLITKALSVLLAPLVPGWMIAHMVLAVARKPS